MRPRRRGRAIARLAGRWAKNGFSLNARLRGDQELLSEMPPEPGVDLDALGREMDGAMGPLRRGRTLYRGLPADPGYLFGLRGRLEGQEYVDPGFVSTSTDPGVAEIFGSATTLRIQAGPGVPHLDLAGHNDQREVVLGRGLRHRIVGEETVEGRHFLDVAVSRDTPRRRGSRLPRALGAAALLLALVAATLTAAVMALLGASAGCLGGGTASAAGARATGAARQIPAARLHIYMGAARRFDISWPFLASIGVQECGYDGHCGVASSGCAGVMEIAYVRGSECSPDPSVPTLWEEFEVDADGGGASIFDPADAIFTAARILRQAKGAPPAGGSYHGYYEAACSYYGACSSPGVDYAHEVMARAVEFGFGHEDQGEAAGGAEVASAAGHGHHGRSRGQHVVDAAYVSRGSACSAPTSEGTSAASGEAIVRVARSQLGEEEHPPGSNCTKYGPCEEWCALFTAWVWQHAGVAMVGGTAPYAYSGTFYGWVAEHGGRDLGPTATPSPGDAVLYGWGPHESEHVGIVEAVLGEEIVTIEGNFANRVERVGPFIPWLAQGAGEPGPVWAYAEPPAAGPAGPGVEHG